MNLTRDLNFKPTNYKAMNTEMDNDAALLLILHISGESILIDVLFFIWKIKFFGSS